jgi:RNA polymerase sigma-70 factor (ECF subfamily)
LADLYRRHAPALLAYLERMCGGRAEAEDALQETFLRVMKGRGEYREEGRFRAWLFTIATGSCSIMARRAPA